MTKPLTSSEKAVIVLEYADDPLHWTAESLLKRSASILPNLGNTLILVEEPTVAPALRKQLLSSAKQYSCDALLGPVICTIKDYAMTVTPSSLPRISRAASELQLKKELESHIHLFGESDPWRLSNSLLDLFDELTLQGIAVGNDEDGNNINSFVARIQAAWQIDDNRVTRHSDEAKIIYTLWQAWHEQLSEMGLQDESTACIEAMNALTQQTLDVDYIYILGATDLKNSEYKVIKRLLAQGNAQLVLQSTYDEKPYDERSSTIPSCWQRIQQHIEIDPSNYTQIKVASDTINLPAQQFFDTVFHYQDKALPLRAKHFANQYPTSPIKQAMQLISSNGIEQEALIIKRQVNQWLHEGHANIGIISEDRKLARRIRALLERDNIHIYDLAGWTLATTSVATLIENWLRCIETDFSHQALLEFLKSPYGQIHPDKDEFEHALYRFELDIIHREQIASNIKRYLKHIQYRQQRLNWNEQQTATISETLKQLDKTAKKLQKAYSNTQSKHYLTAEQYLSILLENLKGLGLTEQLKSDDAGKTMLQLLERLQQYTTDYPQTISWPDFRDWLGQQFENSHFRPPVESRNIQLLSLAQTRLMSFDRLIIAGNEYAHIPGNPTATPYFNQRVRMELGLNTRQDHLAIKLHDYRRLIENRVCRSINSDSPTLVMTWRHQDQDEEIMATPWLKAIQSFHFQAWNDDLVNQDFYQQVLHELIPKSSANNKNQTNNCYSRATISTQLLPEFISASSHQQLIDCPYKFFCGSVLKLQATEEIQETLSAADYGHKVHTCLEAFHAQIDHYPEPFALAFTEKNRHLAIQHLQTLSERVFKKDIEENFQHRAWLQRWNITIPDYIDWQISRNGRFNIYQTEQLVTKEITANTLLKGRLDRIDINTAPDDKNKSLNVIDYKTGSSNLSGTQIDTGEQTQLLSYALLDDRIESVQYLQLTPRDSSKTKSEIKGEHLDSLKQQNIDRLQTILTQLEQGHDMPAWGDTDACQYCAMSGICRKQVRSQDHQQED